MRGRGMARQACVERTCAAGIKRSGPPERAAEADGTRAYLA